MKPKGRLRLQNRHNTMIDKALKLKSWQLFLLLSNYLLISIVAQENSLLLDILFVINVGLLFGWYYLVIRTSATSAGLKLKYVSSYYLAVVYVYVYTIIDILPLQFEPWNIALWTYIAIIGYLYAVIYVSSSFIKAQNKKGMKSGNPLFVYLQFYFYPIGVFYIDKALKELLSLKH